MGIQVQEWGQKKGIHRTPVLNANYHIVNDPATSECVRVRKKKISKLNERRHKKEQAISTKLTEAEKAIGLAPVVVKTEPITRGAGIGGILYGPQEAGAKFGIPKPIFPFSPVNLLDTP